MIPHRRKSTTINACSQLVCYEFSTPTTGLSGRSFVFFIPNLHFGKEKKKNNLVFLLSFLHQSYKRRHHRGGVTQSLDSRVRTLLKIMVVPRHVEGRESGATTLHGAGYSRGCKRHSQAAVRRQRSLDWMRNGCSYRCSAGTQGTQRLWMLKSRKTGGGGYPGTERQVIRCCKG